MLTRVEKYEITGEIGRGGMATVYRAIDVKLNRPVALKVMHPHLQGAGEARARFGREARSVARLKHPGILQIYDYSGEDSEVSYIATELLTGPTLRRFAEQQGEIPAEMAACFAVAVASALGAAHAEGVIHRDVKPENVLLHENRAVKLTDFGIAQLMDGQSMTTTGQVLGSPGHMAPEQVEGRGCDERSDLFSLGTVLYLLATGTLPFKGANPHQVLKKIADGRFVDPLQVRPSIGEALRAIILKCLHLDPERRYQTAAQLEADLGDFVGQVGIESPMESLAEYLSNPEGVARELRVRTLRHLIEAGEQARLRGKLSVALEHFNRALAMDEGNQRVLKALEKIGRHSRLRKLAAVGLAFVAAAALGLGVFAMSDTWPSRPSSSSARATKSGSRIPPPGSDDGTKPVQKPAQLTVGEPSQQDLRAGAPRSRGRGRPGRALGSRKAPRAMATDVERSVETDSGKGPHRVVFQPFPANVSIGVDGAQPRPFGPSFREVALSPGEHRFEFVGAHECCEDEAVTLVVPEGPGTTTLAPRLKFRPSGLYVVCNTPANVLVDGGKAMGRARSVIEVPHQDGLVETHQITVTAPGYWDYTREVRLRAGSVETVQVTLRPVEGE